MPSTVTTGRSNPNLTHSGRSLPPNNRGSARRTGEAIHDPMIIDSSDEGEKNPGASIVARTKRDHAATFSGVMYKVSSKPVAAHADHLETNHASKLDQASTSITAHSSKALLDCRLKTLESFIPKRQLQGSRLLTAVQKG